MKRCRAPGQGRDPRPGPVEPPAVSQAQFSCWWDRTAGESDGQFRQCLQIAGEVMTGDLSDPTGGADHYHRDDIHPA